MDRRALPMDLFDYEETSETYAEQVEKCPACTRRLERKILLS